MSGTRNRISFKRFFGSILAAALLSSLIALGAQISLRAISNGKFNLPWSELLPIAALSAAVLFIIMLIPANKPVRLLKNLGRVLAFVLALALVWGMGAAWIAQDFFMFPSVPADERAEQQLAADSRFERVLLPSPEGEYSGWLWKNAPDKGALLLYFGGNGEEATNVLSFSGNRNKDGVFDGYNVLMMDNPGYGRSDGKAGEESILQMARAAYDFAASHPNVDKDRIVVGGWSLGTGTAARLAAEKQPAGLLLLSPFYNGREMVNAFGENMLEMDFPVPPVPIRNPFKSNTYARKITCPTMIVAAKDDRMIPYNQSERLSKEFLNVELVTLEEGGHSAAWYEEASVVKIGSFLKQFVAGGTPATENPPLPFATVQP